MSWRLFADPSSKLGGVVAVLLQAFNPQMMRLFAATSGYATDMAGRADTQPWLEWTNNTVTWGVLRAAAEYGPALTPAEQDAFVKEQHIAARLAGVETETLAVTHAELDSYINGQGDWVSLTLPAAALVKDLRRPSLRGNPLKVWTGIVIQDGILWLLPDWARDLFGIGGRP